MIKLTNNIVISYGTLKKHLDQGSLNIIDKYELEYILLAKVKKIYKPFILVWCLINNIIPDNVLTYSLFKYPKVVKDWYRTKILELLKTRDYLIIIDDDPLVKTIETNSTNVYIFDYKSYDKFLNETLTKNRLTLKEYKHV